MPEIFTLLNSLGISYTLHKHPPVFTCSETDKYWADTTAAHTKNLFLKTEKSPHKYFLYILECSQRADLKSLAKSLNLPSRLTFANNTELKNNLGLTPGSVSPFGLINDQNHLVTVAISSQLQTKSYLLFHPNTNTATLEISWENFKKFLSHTGHNYKLITTSKP